MKKNFVFSVEAILICCAVSGAALILWPRLSGPDFARRYMSIKNGRAILLALDKYSERHNGEYPVDDAVLGGSDPDGLVRDGCLVKYPRNPFSDPPKPMKKVLPEFASPGNFSYHRLPDKANVFELTVWGMEKKLFSKRSEK